MDVLAHPPLPARSAPEQCPVTTVLHGHRIRCTRRAGHEVAGGHEHNTSIGRYRWDDEE